MRVQCVQTRNKASPARPDVVGHLVTTKTEVSTMYDDLTPRLWAFAVKRLNNIARTLGTKVMARTAYRAGLPIELALQACKGV